MKNVILMFSLLLGSFWIAHFWIVDDRTDGAIGLATVFVFTGLGHFLKTNEMLAMIPPAVPNRRAIVLASGVFELCLAIGLLIPRSARIAGLTAIVFLILALPLNIYAALRRVKFGGHGAGLVYLWIRVPLQGGLAFWSYWFLLRK